MGSHGDVIRLNDLGHEALVSAIAGSRSPDPQMRQSLMEALEAAEEVGGANPRAQTERVIALVNLGLFAMLQGDAGYGAYSSAIQDALDATGRAFQGVAPEPLETTRLGHVWYTLGLAQQATGKFQEAVGLYQRAAQTALSVPEDARDLRLLILVGTNIATCADKLGLDDLAKRTRAHVEVLLRLLGGS